MSIWWLHDCSMMIPWHFHDDSITVPHATIIPWYFNDDSIAITWYATIVTIQSHDSFHDHFMTPHWAFHINYIMKPFQLITSQFHVDPWQLFDKSIIMSSIPWSFHDNSMIILFSHCVKRATLCTAAIAAQSLNVVRGTGMEKRKQERRRSERDGEGQIDRESQGISTCICSMCYFWCCCCYVSVWLVLGYLYVIDAHWISM